MDEAPARKLRRTGPASCLPFGRLTHRFVLVTTRCRFGSIEISASAASLGGLRFDSTPDARPGGIFRTRRRVERDQLPVGARAPRNSSPSAPPSCGTSPENNEVGAAVAVWVDGDLVVNLWGGHSDARRRRRWRENTLASVFSGTKGADQHLCASTGRSRRTRPVRPGGAYWPEFGVAGKRDITIASVLGHRSGVIGPRTRLHWNDTTDWDRVCEQIAASEPWWEPEPRGYHMVTFGFILGEVVRRVTAAPSVSICAPDRRADGHRRPHRPTGRRTPPLRGHGQQTAHPGRAGQGRGARRSGIARRASDGRAVDRHGVRARRRARLQRAESLADGGVPGTNGHVSARGLATFYNGLAQGKLLSAEHLESVPDLAGRLRPRRGARPRVADHGWGLGYMLNQRGVAGPNLRSFGHGGSGGSYGFVDLENRIGYAYVMNYFDATRCNADPRSTALSDEVYRVLGCSDNKFPYRGAPPWGRYCGRHEWCAVGADPRRGRRDRPGGVEFVARVRQPQRGKPGRCQGRCPAGDRTPRQPGAEPHRHQRRLGAGAGRRLGAVHRRLVTDRAGHHRQAGDAGQKESAIEGLYYVRAARTAMGMDPGPGGACPARRRRVRSPRTARCSSRAADRGLPRCRRADPELCTRAAGSPGAGPPPAGTPSRGGRRHWWPVRGAWARCCCSTRCSPACRVSYGASGFENGYGSGFDQGFDQGYDQGLDARSDGGGWGGDRGRRRRLGQ